ncbi:helix-turn-helix domain-containing protein [Micromonospora sp. H33]|uniref:helix-turn-helix domain-containing protein n=1 Tax=Micromonospora sp. H33 TaxID=3452215 RepID=UPI003F8BCABF
MGQLDSGRNRHRTPRRVGVSTGLSTGFAALLKFCPWSRNHRRMSEETRLDVGAALRAARHRADLSQRELAERSGVPKSTLARLESRAESDPRLRTVERLLQAAGYELVVRVRDSVEGPDGVRLGGEELGGEPHGEARDEAGRRYPAHLDVRKVRTLHDWPGAWWAHWYTLPPERWPLRVPEFTYDLDRERRDDRRLRQWLPGALSVRRCREGLPDGSWRLVAELPDGRRVGELRAHEQSDDLLLGYDLDDRNSLVLDGIVVAPQLRMMGIGRRLVTLLGDEMSRAGLWTVHAVASGDGVGFLLACGYRKQWGGSPVALRFDLAGTSGSVTAVATPGGPGRPR